MTPPQKPAAGKGWLRFFRWEERGHRLYDVTLDRESEDMLVAKIVNDIRGKPESWELGPHNMTNGHWEIWTCNATYADMNIKKPYEVNLSWAGAKRLREERIWLIVRSLGISPSLPK